MTWCVDVLSIHKNLSNQLDISYQYRGRAKLKWHYKLNIFGDQNKRESIRFTKWESYLLFHSLYFKTLNRDCFVWVCKELKTTRVSKPDDYWGEMRELETLNQSDLRVPHREVRGVGPSYLLLWQTDGEAECRKSIPPLLSSAVIQATQFWDPTHFYFRTLGFLLTNRVSHILIYLWRPTTVSTLTTTHWFSIIYYFKG